MQPTEDDKQTYDEALLQCACVDRMACHFNCGVALSEEPTDSDEEAWADYSIPDPTQPGKRLHILAHAYCAQGQIGVERA